MLEGKYQSTTSGKTWYQVHYVGRSDLGLVMAD